MRRISRKRGCLITIKRICEISSTPHDVRPHDTRHCFTANACVVLVGDRLVGPYLLPFPMTSTKYRIFIEQVHPCLLQDLPQNVKCKMWFQLNGATLQSRLCVRQHLITVFGPRWIRRSA